MTTQEELLVPRFFNFAHNTIEAGAATLESTIASMTRVLALLNKELEEEKATKAKNNLYADKLLFTTFNELDDGAHFICVRDQVEIDMFSKRRFLVQTKLNQSDAAGCRFNAVDSEGDTDTVDNYQMVIEVYYAGSTLWLDR